MTDATMAAALRAMLDEIKAPPVPLDAIRRRMKQGTSRQWRRFSLPAAAIAIAMLVLALPRVAPGLTQTIEQQVKAILHWTPPPPPPSSVESALRSWSGTLAEAQARVTFTIVPPADLPMDAALERITTTATGVYSYLSHRWSVGSPAVWFIYRRVGGREFSLLADRFDPREGTPTAYIFEDLGERNGREVLVKHEKFTWRNGDQVMSAVAGEGLNAAEIIRIRAGMHGTAISRAWQRAVIVKRYRLP
jgi:hypothetical protein